MTSVIVIKLTYSSRGRKSALTWVVAEAEVQRIRPVAQRV